MLSKRRVICIVVTSFGLVSASSFISEKVVSDIALHNATTLWGEIVSAPPQVYYGLDDKPIAYGFVFAKGRRFPDYAEILKEVEKARREGKIKELWGENRYYRMVVAARRNMPPIPVYGEGLLENYVLNREFKEAAEKTLRTKDITLTRIYYITPLEKWYGYTNGQDTVYIRLYPPKKVYTSKEFDNLIRRPLLENLFKMEKPEFIFDELWQEFEKGKTLSLADHFIYRYDLVPYYDWSYGCSPTAAAMLLGYWDNLGNEGLGSPFSNFIDHHFQRYSSVEGEIDYQVPNLQQELAIAMHTDSTTGGTDIYAVGPGIQTVADDNSYGFVVSGLLFGNASNDWLWTTILGEVDNNRPFKWGVMSDLTGHSLTGVGYTDSKYVITHNTWYPPLDYWYYNQWYDGSPVDFTTVNTVTPGGSYGYSVKLTSPLGDTFYNSDGGGEVWDAGQTYEITWDGDLGIGYVSLEYSINGGLTWRTITDNTGNTGSYFWDVPSYFSTQEARVRIKGYDASHNLMAGDGSKGNFIIQGTPAPYMEVRPDTIIFDYSSTEKVILKPRRSISHANPPIRPLLEGIKMVRPIPGKSFNQVLDTLHHSFEEPYFGWTPGFGYQIRYEASRLIPVRPCTVKAVQIFFYNWSNGIEEKPCSLFVYEDDNGLPGAKNIAMGFQAQLDGRTYGWMEMSTNLYCDGPFWIAHYEINEDSITSLFDTIPSPGDYYSFDGNTWYPEDLAGDHIQQALVTYLPGGNLVGTMWIKNIGSATLEITDMLPSESWIKRVSPNSLSLVPDDSQAVEVEVDTTGLGGGVYDGYITIHSNDPEKLSYDEPVRLIIEGLAYPDISVFPDTLKFEFTSMDDHTRDSKSLVMWVKNEGTEDLMVTDITTEVTWITYIQPKHFNVAPSDSQVVAVKVDDFGLPSGIYYGFLLISSNDPDERPYVQPVKLIKIGEPDIAVKPDTLSYDLSIGEPLINTIWVSNPGKSDLNVTPQTITPWISSILPSNFTVLPDDSLSVEVRIDTTVLSDGLFYGEILLYNNTSTKSPYIEPVSLYKSPGILDKKPILPTVFRLRKISPNPVMTLAHIYYDLPHNSQMSLKVYDASGKLVKILIGAIQEAGFKSIEWKGIDDNGKTVPPGIYFIRMTTPEYEGVEKLILYR